MWSSLRSVLVDLFMGHHKVNWIADYNKGKPTFYKRFMDDILCILRNKNEATEFLNYLNERHPNIKFTDEKEILNKLPFQTSVYRKIIFTNLLTNFCSFIPFAYKLALIKTLVHRIFHICNSWEIFHNNILELEKYS